MPFQVFEIPNINKHIIHFENFYKTENQHSQNYYTISPLLITSNTKLADGALHCGILALFKCIKYYSRDGSHAFNWKGWKLCEQWAQKKEYVKIVYYHDYNFSWQFGIWFIKVISQHLSERKDLSQ